MDETEETSYFLTFLFWGSAFAFALFFVRRFIKGAQFNERVSAKDKVVVITGANSGIGLELAKELNLRKAKVYMLCRDEKRAFDGKTHIAKLGCDPTRLIIEKCDLANFASVRDCAKRLLQAENSIDILINNAAVMFYPKYEKTVDGHEMHWQTNYLGPFLLTELLLPALRRAQSARVVNVSSELHLKSDRIDVSVIDDKKQFGILQPYNRSKLANVMHATALTRRLRKEGTHNVIVNSCHPGVVYTELLRSLFISKPPFKQISQPFRWFFTKTARDGAQTPLFLALSKKVEAVSGKYFAECAIAAEHAVALDESLCDDLYNYSLETVGVQSE